MPRRDFLMKTILQTVGILILFLSSSPALIAQTGSPLESVAAAQSSAKKRGGNEAPEAQKAAQVARAKSMLEKAVAVLCPSGLADGSPRKELVETAIDQFLSGQVPDTLNTLKELNSKDSETPPADFLLAGFWFAVGDRGRGLAQLEQNAVQHPDYPGVYLSFAQLALNDNRISDAALNAGKTQELVSQGDLSETWREHFLKQYYEIVANVQMRRQQGSEAERTLDRLQNVKPDLPFYFLNKAKLRFEAGQQAETIRYLKQYAKSIGSKRLPELSLVGWLRDQGKSQEARDLLLATIDAHADDADSLQMAAEMYLAEEEFAKTLTMIERFEKANGGETYKSIEMKGRIAFAGLSYDVAAGHFRALATRDSQNANNATVLALSLIESDDPDKQKEAQVILQQVVKRLPKNSLAVAALGYALMKNGETKSAAEAMRHVAMARQGSSEISWFLANWLAAKGQQQDAIRLLTNAVEVKGFFLYRSAARKLLAKLKAASAE